MLTIHPDDRRKGIAYKMLELLIVDAKKKESKIFLWMQLGWAGRYMKNMDS